MLTDTMVNGASLLCEDQVPVLQSQRDAQRYCRVMQTTTVSRNHQVEPSVSRQQDT